MFRKTVLTGLCLALTPAMAVSPAGAASLAAMMQVDPASLATEIIDAMAAMPETSTPEQIAAEINRVLALSGATADEALEALALVQDALIEGSAADQAVELVRAQIQATGEVATGAGGGDGGAPTPPPPGGGDGGSDYDTGG
ncbi:hypothetical protein [Euryhalocaulis caribicus]|uniref:hypothetical protein n=1 Tax=Euryhalocaulis caribicus TaxID=1161401 RepID=UPI00039DB28B|nr:hypothetical protein [Euryhalocaulis caribicus]